MTLAWWLSACVKSGAPADLGLEVDLTEDPIVFRWSDGRKVHELQVVECLDDCEQFFCEDGQLGYASYTELWSVGYGYDDGEWWNDPPAISPPVVYGRTDVPGDRRHVDPLVLEPGVPYVVTVSVDDNCHGGEQVADGSCNTQTGSGCVGFEL